MRSVTGAKPLQVQLDIMKGTISAADRIKMVPEEDSNNTIK